MDELAAGRLLPYLSNPASDAQRHANQELAKAAVGLQKAWQRFGRLDLVEAVTANQRSRASTADGTGAMTFFAITAGLETAGSNLDSPWLKGAGAVTGILTAYFIHEQMSEVRRGNEAAEKAFSPEIAGAATYMRNTWATWHKQCGLEPEQKTTVWEDLMKVSESADGQDALTAIANHTPGLQTPSL